MGPGLNGGITVVLAHAWLKIPVLRNMLKHLFKRHGHLAVMS